MKTRTTVLIVTTFIVALSMAAFAAETTAKAKPVTKAPEGFLIIEEEMWMPLVQDPIGLFDNAREALGKKDFKASAADLRKAAALIRLEASRALGNNQEALAGAETEVNAMATEIEKEVITDEKVLAVVLGRAERTLAAHHHALANAALAKGNKAKTAHHMLTSSAYLDRSLIMLSYKEEAAATAAIEAARAMAGTIVEGAGWVPDEIGKVLSALGGKIEELGAKIEPKS